TLIQGFGKRTRGGAHSGARAAPQRGVGRRDAAADSLFRWKVQWLSMGIGGLTTPFSSDSVPCPTEGPATGMGTENLLHPSATKSLKDFFGAAVIRRAGFSHLRSSLDH